VKKLGDLNHFQVASRENHDWLSGGKQKLGIKGGPGTNGKGNRWEFFWKNGGGEQSDNGEGGVDNKKGPGEQE